jgi:hypothetical protein
MACGKIRTFKNTRGGWMQLTEISEKLKGLQISEKRLATQEMLEFVFESKEVPAWQSALEAILGTALKPSGEKSNPLANKLTKPFGGIRADQTLYYKIDGNNSVMAMFWPWQSGKFITCKIIYLDTVVQVRPSLFSRWLNKD